MSMYINAPYAPQSNPPIEPQNYKPGIYFITAITYGTTTTFTTGDPDWQTIDVSASYVVGQRVRFLLPFYYGARQFNGLTAIVISFPSSNQILVNIDSRYFDPFIPSPTQTGTRPQVIAIGDVNSGQINSSGRINNSTYIPGSFRDIS